MSIAEDRPRFVLIAGPCLAESEALLHQVAEPLTALANELDCEFYFKASFDKANRTSGQSARGPGWKAVAEWFGGIKAKYHCKTLTDIHESDQVDRITEVCEGVQIPAFLCRQTDLVKKTAAKAQFLNIKKGQFLDPASMGHILKKALTATGDDDAGRRVGLTERGTFFGYGDLVVDMRSFKTMADNDRAVVIYDATHSVQQPAGAGGVSGGHRHMVAGLARAAAATGYIDGMFLEVHPCPDKAMSDAASQLSIEQALPFIRQIHGIWQESKRWREIDSSFSS